MKSCGRKTKGGAAEMRGCALFVMLATAGAALPLASLAGVFKIDSSKTPEKAEWADKELKPALEGYVDKVVELLDGKGAKWTRGEVVLTLDPRYKGAAEALSEEKRITLGMKFARDFPDEVKGACVHEFAHVVQDYRPTEGRARPYKAPPSWLVEGIADWVRWCNYEGEEGRKGVYRMARENPKHDDSYKITAAFLDYVVRKYDPDLVMKLNGICREGKYGENVWVTLTGKSRQSLAAEWKRFLRGGAAEKVVTSASAGDILKWVDPFIGTQGTGHTTPAAACPFGMVQPGPDTSHAGWEHCSAYQYGDRSIERFSQNHLSGTGCSEFTDVGFMPFAGDFNAAWRRDCFQKIDKKTEKASPGYYAVTLDTGVRVEVTCTERVALYRFTYSKAPAHLLFDPSWAFRTVQSVDFAPMKDRKVSGHVFRDGWPDHDYWFAWEVSKEPSSSRVVERVGDDRIEKTAYSFDMKEGDVLCLKVSLSRTSAEGARRNIDAEIPGWDFDGVLAQAQEKWRAILSRVEAKGTKDQLKGLYTSIYHLCFQPNLISDVGEPTVYSTFSCWDTYRAAGPLYTILTPERVPDFINSMLWHFDQNGFLPVWTLWGGDNQCMIGVHSVPMIVDAYLKGFKGVDWERAWRCMKTTLTKNRRRHKARYDLLDKYGYYPCDIVEDEGVSRQLEDCYDDACAARFAMALGKKRSAKFFRDRSLSWTNCFDAATGFIRAKNRKGAWREPFDPYKISHINHCDYTEGNAFHWNWHVMQSPDLIVRLLGGKDAALKRLEGLFIEDSTKGVGAIPDVTGLIGQYCHGNEPSHHVIYFFSLLGRRDLAAKYVHEVMETQYGTTPDGLCGNDDCGQMSAWYVFACLGFYPFDPCGAGYVLGEAQIPEVAFKVGDGRTFRVVSSGSGDSASPVTLDGRKIDGVHIRHEDVMKGGTLVFGTADGK